MPNWCSNNLTISHKDAKMITRAKKAFEDSRLFEEFVPTPEGNDDSWYEFHINNWGTKWDVCNGAISFEHKNEIGVVFDTAWGPPIAFYGKMEEFGFEVQADYCEPGMQFVGEYSNGNDDCYEYGSYETKEQIEENVPEHLVESYNILGEYEEWEGEYETYETEDEEDISDDNFTAGIPHGE